MSEPNALGQASQTWSRILKSTSPVEQARAASALLRDRELAHEQVAALRRQAIEDAIDQGMTASEVEAAIGLTKGRVSQIRSHH